MCNIIHGSEKPCQTKMVCACNDLIAWKDFPKGLRVLLLDENNDSAAVIKRMLEKMDYIVTSVCNAGEAILALSNKLENFHIAIVEVNTNNNEDIFNFLETFKELPIILISNIYCVSTIMKGISLGAVEFLQKPLSGDKLKNIWQHAVHKAPISINGTSIKELNNGESGNHISEKLENEPALNDKYPAPSTPQLEHGGRLLLDGDFQDQINCCSSEKEVQDQDVGCKFVEITCEKSDAEITVEKEDMDEGFEELPIKEKTENNRCVNHKNRDSVNSLAGDYGVKSTKTCTRVRNPCARAKRKKLKVDWTAELHKKFVVAVEKLGVEQAIPSRILEVMKVEGLTRHNVASHLQKYRMHHRHILPKQHNNNNDWWPNKFHYPHPPPPPIIRPYSQTDPLGSDEVGLVWGHPSTAAHRSGFQMWGPPVHYMAWPTPEFWHWNQNSTKMHADAWGCPVVMQPHAQYPNFSLNPSCRLHSSFFMPPVSFAIHPGEEAIEKAVKEALMKPWSPLPIGLKPPSMDTVLAEFSKHQIFSAQTMDASNNG